MAIKRIDTGPRMSGAVVHNGVVYLSGQVGTPGASVGDQTREILGEIERLLAAAGTDKTRLLSATIWLADIADFDEMNRAWDAWVPKGQAPARATGESRLAAPGYKVEIIALAAI